MCIAGFAASPGKPRVPYCEERPGVAHSRRDQLCVCGFRGEPRKTAGPILRGAARSRTLQEGPIVCCGFRGEPGETAGPVLRGAARCRTLQEGPRHSPRRVVRYPLAMLKQALEDELTQFYKGLSKRRRS